MTDPISSIRGAAASEAYQPLEPIAAQPAATQPGPDRSAPAQPAATQSAPARPEARAPAAEAARPSATAAIPNVHFRFNIDPKTNDVTVIMFDATAHKVLRTIPASDFQKLSQGELLSLWA